MPGGCWKVIGGSDKGGILVRVGQSTTSEQAPGRLSTGAVVREVALVGERLQYELIQGTGPKEGWVSVKLKDKDLLARADDEALPADADALETGYTAEGFVKQYKAGKLRKLIREYRQLLATMPYGPPTTAPREAGVGTPFEGYVPAADAGGRPKVLFTGDQLTHGPPLNTTAAYVAALAQKNPHIFVENAGWAAAMSTMLLEPQAFGLPVPRPGEYAAQYVVVVIGTNDAIAMSAPETYVDQAWVMAGPARLPPDWRTSCPPCVELFEQSVTALVQRHKASGAKVALATPPPLGEDLTDSIPEKHSKKLRRSPFVVVSELAAAVRRIAEAEDCALLPLFECACHFLGRLGREGVRTSEGVGEAITWTPQGFNTRLNAGINARRAEIEQGKPVRQFSEFGHVQGRPDLCFDLVHFNEDGGALLATLVQTWLDAAMAAEAEPGKGSSSQSVGIPPVVDAEGTSIDLKMRASGKRVALYFSAGWCPMCTSFEPALEKYCSEAAAMGKPVECILVSSDSSASDARERAMSLGMLQVEYDGSSRDALKRKFHVWPGKEVAQLGSDRRSGVPALVVLDESCEEIAFIDAERSGAASLEKWPIGGQWT